MGIRKSKKNRQHDGIKKGQKDFFRHMLICFVFSSAIVLSVLGFMVSDDLFDIFKLFFQNLFTGRSRGKKSLKIPKG
jgi:hypothetical protein